MTLFALLFGVQIISVLIVYLALRKLYGYIRVYRFTESIYTLLFGFLHLHYFVLLYIATVILTVMMELFFAFSFLKP